MNSKSTKKGKSIFNLRQLLLNLFDIKETTSKGKKWVRVENEQHVKWV